MSHIIDDKKNTSAFACDTKNPEDTLECHKEESCHFWNDFFFPLLLTLWFILGSLYLTSLLASNAFRFDTNPIGPIVAFSSFGTLLGFGYLFNGGIDANFLPMMEYIFNNKQKALAFLISAITIGAFYSVVYYCTHPTQDYISAPLNTYEKAITQPLPKTHYLLKSGMTIPATLFYTQDYNHMPSLISVTINNAVLDSLTHEVIIPQGAHFFGNYHFSLIDGQAFIFIIWDTLIFPSTNSYATPYSVKLAPDNITDVLSIFHQMPFVSIIKIERCSHHEKLCLPENALIDVNVQNGFNVKVPPINDIKIVHT